MTDTIESLAEELEEKTCGCLDAHREWVYGFLTRARDLGPVWMPIESAPRGNRRQLVFVPPYGAMTGHFNEALNRWSCHSTLDKGAQPTHWMPLPQPPAQEPGQ